jgi:predicted adenylyl cyclase CyaB
MKNIEVEIRSFLTKSEYKKLLNFMKKNAKFIDKDYQITYYFSGSRDLRIQKNNSFAKLWLKRGKLHDRHREEIEIKFNREDFDKLENLLKILGFGVEIKWFRRRHVFEWNGFNTMLDYTKGYGHIIEIEKMCSKKEKNKVYKKIKKALKKLSIKPTPKKEFERKFKYYKKNWKKLLKLN